MISINTNTTAVTTANNLVKTQSSLSSSMEKLSTGLRINSAADDAAGLQISNRMTTQMNGVDVAMRNANDAISMSQVAEGAMSENTDILNRIRDLSLQSANDTNTLEDREAMQKEVAALTEEVDRIASTTSFAGRNLLDGSASNLTFQVGSNANETISLSIGDMSAGALQGTVTTYDSAAGTAFDSSSAQSVTVGDQTIELEAGVSIDDAIATLNDNDSGVTFSQDSSGNLVASAGADSAEGLEITGAGFDGSGMTKTETVKSLSDIDLTTSAGAQEAIQILDGALSQIDSNRADMGAVQNRLESTIDNLSNISENLGTAKSRITDVDFAKETLTMTSDQMKMQASSTILSQAKGLSSNALSMLG